MTKFLMAIVLLPLVTTAGMVDVWGVDCSGLKTVFAPSGDVERVKNMYKWQSGVAFVEILRPVIDGDPGATVTGDAETGLFYQLREGETLGGMKDGDSKVGDGQPWSPKITVKGGNSAFYSIGVGKGG